MAGSDRVARRFGDVLASGWRGPPDVAAGQMLSLPPRILFHPVVESALRVPITQTRTATGLIRGAMFEVAVFGRAAAPRPGTRGVPDLGQVPQLDPGVMPGGLPPVVAVPGGDRLDVHDQAALPGYPGGQPPAAIAARWSGLGGRGEGEPGRAGAGRVAGRIRATRRAWPARPAAGAGAVAALRFGPGAALRQNWTCGRGLRRSIATGFLWWSTASFRQGSSHPAAGPGVALGAADRRSWRVLARNRQPGPAGGCDGRPGQDARDLIGA